MGVKEVDRRDRISAYRKMSAECACHNRKTGAHLENLNPSIKYQNRNQQCVHLEDKRGKPNPEVEDRVQGLYYLIKISTHHIVPSTSKITPINLGASFPVSFAGSNGAKRRLALEDASCWAIDFVKKALLRENLHCRGRRDLIDWFEAMRMMNADEGYVLRPD